MPWTPPQAARRLLLRDDDKEYPERHGDGGREQSLQAKASEPSTAPHHAAAHRTASQVGGGSWEAPPHVLPSLEPHVSSSPMQALRAARRASIAVLASTHPQRTPSGSPQRPTQQDNQRFIDDLLESTELTELSVSRVEPELRARLQHVDRYISQMEERLQTRSGICPENADYSVTYQLFPDATPALEPEYARVNLVRMGSDLNIEGATEAVEVSDLRPGGSKPFPLRRTLTRQESIADMMGGEREELLTRYRNLCMSKGKTALQEMAGPLLGEGGGTLACPRRSLGDAGVTAMAQFFSYLSNLHTIDLADNAIHDQGATALARALRAVPALRELVLDDNKIGNRGSEAVADTMAARSCKMETFSVARNNLGDPSLAFLLDSLAGKTSIVSIDVSFNSLAQCSCKALAGVLSKCANLRTLDCHWGHMRAHGAVTFAEGLAMSTSLTSLNLAFNGFGDLAPCSALCDALAKDTCAIVSLDLSCNRIGEKAACLIAAKGMNLSLSLERLILDKNPIGRTGCKRIMAASFGPSTASAAQADGDTSGGADGATQPGGGRAMMRARRKSDARGLEECEATVEADAKIEVSLKDCSAQRVNKESFNPVEPGGDYVIDLGDPYWRQVALDMLKLEFSGNGKIERNTVLLDRKFYKLKKIDRSNFDEDILPETGDLSFRFDSLRKPPSSQAKMEDQMHARILALMEVKGSDDGVDLLEVVITGGSIIGIDQATALLTKVKDSERKVRIAHLTFHHLVPQDSAPKILALLSEGEMKMLQKLLGSLSVEFTPNNPTGTHKLNLGVAEERSIGNNLRSWRCAEGTIQEVADKLVAQMLGGRRDFIEKVWRNCTLNGGAWPYRNHVQFPAVGELCFDYTKLSRPQDENREVESISDTRWGFFIEEIEGWEGEEIVKAFRALSNDQVFLCRHVRVVLSRVKPSQVALRVEVCVTAFSRTLDFYGFYGYR
ncbi:hypothetical protein T484DRAFT_1963883, partial [Baffinella frigidus]